ncbi:Nephrocystin-3 [Frankliniella fusca]|uniref:Nephrocystin-3 n=1 Tax=Frankliniella fusca TaxID=407009 RepID=A0AAE1LLC1_9NEOP|nr:Nephrocystin-3 [Frankliniella fusca]KAK3922761.1 Nephrocystin-3 [Frankliniella fusca]
MVLSLKLKCKEQMLTKPTIKSGVLFYSTALLRVLSLQTWLTKRQYLSKPASPLSPSNVVLGSKMLNISEEQVLGQIGS